MFGQPLVDSAEERTIPGPEGDIPIRVFVPPTVDAVYLSIHGGAFMMGSRRSSDQTNWRVAGVEQRRGRQPRVPHGARAPVPVGATTTAKPSPCGCSSTVPPSSAVTGS